MVACFGIWKLFNDFYDLTDTPAAFLLNHKFIFSSFPIQDSMLDVRCSMFIFLVNLPQSPGEIIT